MPAAARLRPLRLFRRATVVLLIGLAVAGGVFLPYAGRFLAAEDPLERADVIVVLAGSRAERWLEAVDLYREGWAPRIVLSPGRVEEGEIELRRRGVRFPTDAELVRNAIAQLGVPVDAVMIIPGSLDNTAQEAAATRRMALDAGWRRVLVVTSKYHSRRTRFAFRRAFRDTSVGTAVKATRYDRSTPERWWRNRADIRWVTSELQKLVLYRLGLGT